ncbi:hypothetical protein [Paenibacillus cremeus]|uniref:hypothetical protein n=1 Tax=Paenibacillus cremeus TaxID=2163881 RepID=UPI0011A76534|nr:hypothetical protein [Paenibacillus cremeus]
MISITTFFWQSGILESSTKTEGHFTPSRAEAWLDCMNQALEEVIPSVELRSIILKRLSGPARFFVNTQE